MSFRLVVVASLLALTSACVGASDVDDPDDTDIIDDELPDVSGTYAVVPEAGEASGDDCPDVDLLAWADGDLVVSGEPTDLSFDFGDDAVFTGLIDELGGFELAGTTTQEGTPLAVSAAGVFYSEDDRWVLDGDLVADVDDGSGSCTIEAPFRATQVVE